MARVEICNLSKAFPGSKDGEVWALRHVELTVADGEFLALVGPSGAGKSTLLRIVAGLEDATEGTISIGGLAMDNVPPQDRDIAMVFQHHALYPHLTARENMALGLKLRKFPPPEIKRRVDEAAAMLGLASCLDRRPAALSGGERQRVALGRALVRQPKVFLFDEPLSNLDARMRGQMRAEIRRLHQQLGATMIYVTHDQAEAMTMGDRIAVMKGGVIQQVAAPLTLYREPANLFVAGFVGSPPMNFFRGRLTGGDGAIWFEAKESSHEPPRELSKTGNGKKKCTIPGLDKSPGDFVAGEQGRQAMEAFLARLPEEQAQRVATAVGRAVILGLRPEHISCDGGPGGVTGTAIVEMTETTGPETDLHLTAGGESFVARLPAGPSWRAGDEIPFRFDMVQAHFFDPVTEAALG